MTKKKSMVTPKEYAKLTNTPYSTVMSWLQRELIPDVERCPLPSGGWYYLVPAAAPKPALRRGPKPKKAGRIDKSRKAKKAD